MADQTTSNWLPKIVLTIVQEDQCPSDGEAAVGSRDDEPEEGPVGLPVQAAGIGLVAQRHFVGESVLEVHLGPADLLLRAIEGGSIGSLSWDLGQRTVDQGQTCVGCVVQREEFEVDVETRLVVGFPGQGWIGSTDFAFSAVAVAIRLTVETVETKRQTAVG